MLLNHAIAESDDAGETWTVAQVVAGAIGPTCEGSIARHPGGAGGLVISLPHYPRWRCVLGLEDLCGGGGDDGHGDGFTVTLAAKALYPPSA